MPAPLDTVKPSGAPIVAPSDAPTTVPSDAPSDGPVSISYGVDRNTLYLKLLTDEASPGLLVTLPDTGRFIANWQGFSYRDIEFINENPDIVDFGTEAGEGTASGLEGSYSWPITAKAPGYAIIGIKNTITSESYTQGVTVLDGGALAVDVK
jgi:hypothetical protein